MAVGEKNSQSYLLTVSRVAQKLFWRKVGCDETKMSVQEIFLNFQIDDKMRQKRNEADEVTY